MTLVHRAFIESILTFYFICWFGSLGVKQKSSPNSIVKVSNKIIWTWAACLTSTKSNCWTNYSPSWLIAPIPCIQSTMCCLQVFALGSHESEPTDTNILLTLCYQYVEFRENTLIHFFRYFMSTVLFVYCYANNCSLGDNKVVTDWSIDSPVHIRMNAFHLAQDP